MQSTSFQKQAPDFVCLWLSVIPISFILNRAFVILVFQLCSHLAPEMPRRKSFGSLLVLSGVLASWLIVPILPIVLYLDTFNRLVPEYARQLTDVNLATRMLVWNSFMTFQHLPSPHIPICIQQFMSTTSDDIALRLGDQDVFSCYMHEFIDYMNPPPVHLQRLTANVRPMDVPTVVTDLKTFIFADGLQDKPNSVPVLCALNDRLSSFAHLIPQVDLDGVVVLSLHDALARVHILKDCQRSRADLSSKIVSVLELTSLKLFF
jgi:hypothetical protein